MTITNFGSGAIEIADENGRKVRLDREAANRLVMAGRMHTVAEFVEKLPALIPDTELTAAILEAFHKAPASSGKWNLKEKFARLTTLSKGYESKNPSEVIETATL
jgi:hypothetical protein